MGWGGRSRREYTGGRREPTATGPAAPPPAGLPASDRSLSLYNAQWFKERNGRPDWQAAVDHLASADPVMRRMIAKVGPCTLAPLPDPFSTLVLSIFSQQLSTKGAETLFKRFRGHFPRGRIGPRSVHRALSGGLDPEVLRHCGISRQKHAYLLDLCGQVMQRRIVWSQLHLLEDEAVIERLCAVKGIGHWTAQMFLMFSHCRPDVLPVADLGIQESARQHYRLAARPDAATLSTLAEPWRPWRTVGCWYLWRAKEG